MHEIALTRDAAADAREIEELENTVAELEHKAAEASRITELQTSVEALEAEVQQFRAERLQRGSQMQHARGYGAHESPARSAISDVHRRAPAAAVENRAGNADEEASGLSFTQSFSPGTMGSRLSV